MQRKESIIKQRHSLDNGELPEIIIVTENDSPIDDNLEVTEPPDHEDSLTNVSVTTTITNTVADQEDYKDNQIIVSDEFSGNIASLDETTDTNFTVIDGQPVEINNKNDVEGKFKYLNVNSNL